MKLIDDESLRPYTPSKIESHKSVSIGSALLVPYEPPGVRGILMQAVTDDVRYTLDGTTPTAAIGFRLIQDTAPTFVEIDNNTVIKFYGEGGTSKVEYQWFE